MHNPSTENEPARPMETDRESTVRRGAAAAALATTGVLHGYVMPGHFDESIAITLLLCIAASLCLGLAAQLWNDDDPRVWAAGVAVTGGLVSGFVASRTVGLPGFDRSGTLGAWAEGLPAISVALIFLCLASDRWNLADPPTATATGTAPIATATARGDRELVGSGRR